MYFEIWWQYIYIYTYQMWRCVIFILISTDQLGCKFIKLWFKIRKEKSRQFQGCLLLLVEILSFLGTFETKIIVFQIFSEYLYHWKGKKRTEKDPEETRQCAFSGLFSLMWMFFPPLWEILKRKTPVNSEQYTSLL